MYYLDVMFDEGSGVAQNYKTAVKWYKLAAEQGNANAQYNLGLMYQRGLGVPKDYIHAHMWLNLTVIQGDTGAISAKEIIEKNMSSTQLETAERLARECFNNNFKRC